MVPNGKLISVWGDPRDGGKRRHEGEDLFAPHGSPIYAPLDLAIYKNEWNRRGGWAVNGRDAFGRRWYFAHLNQQSHLEVGSTIKAGQIIGYVGNTGNAITTPPHLHYQVTWPDGDWGNPVDVLRNYPETEDTAHASPAP
jgi:murein DD-endopeptidase MepM/ murein hydrolase activator NlpD